MRHFCVMTSAMWQILRTSRRQFRRGAALLLGAASSQITTSHTICKPLQICAATTTTRRSSTWPRPPPICCSAGTPAGAVWISTTSPNRNGKGKLGRLADAFLRRWFAFFTCFYNTHHQNAYAILKKTGELCDTTWIYCKILKITA